MTHATARNMPVTSLYRTAAAFVCAVLAACVLALGCPGEAQAVTTAENTAYQRCVAAIKDYAHKPATIVVNVKDLKLTYKQICAVYERVHYDGHYFWVNTFGNPPKTTDSISFKCIYSDSKITSMRSTFNSRVKSALSWAPPQLAQAERVHMLHDWLIEHADYVYDNTLSHKFSYGTLCQGKGDCLSFALGMRVLLSEAGFTTEICYDHREGHDNHAWVHVKVGGVWYNVDPTWDNAYTGKYYWPDCICHMYLLVNDNYMNKSDLHPGFYAAHKNTSASYAKKFMDKDWELSCRKWCKVGAVFRCGDFTYKVGKNHTAKVYRCKATSKKTVTIPTQVAYRGHSYKITSIDVNALSASKARTLVVKASYITKVGAKGALKKSKVTLVQVKKANVKAAVYNKYRAYFAKANSGKSVRMKYS